MGLFKQCSRCRKKTFSFFIGSDGLCSDCHFDKEASTLAVTYRVIF